MFLVTSACIEVMCVKMDSNFKWKISSFFRVEFLESRNRRNAIIARNLARTLAAVTESAIGRSTCRARSGKIVFFTLLVRFNRSALHTMASSTRPFTKPMLNAPFVSKKWGDTSQSDRLNRHAVRSGSTKCASWKRLVRPAISSNARCAITRMNFGKRWKKAAFPYRTSE